MKNIVRALTVGAALSLGACSPDVQKPAPDVTVVQSDTARKAEEARQASAAEEARKAEEAKSEAAAKAYTAKEAAAKAALQANVPEYQAGFPKVESVVKEVFPKARADFQKRIDAHVAAAKKLLASEKAKDGQPIPDPGEGPTTYSFDPETVLHDFVQTVLPGDEGDLAGKRAAFTKMSYTSTSAQGQVNVEFFDRYSDTALSAYLYNRIAQALPEYSLPILNEGEALSGLVTKAVRLDFALPESAPGKQYGFSVRSLNNPENGTEYALSIDYGEPWKEMAMESYYHSSSPARGEELASERFDYQNAWDPALSQNICTPNCVTTEGADPVPFQLPAHLQPFAKLW